MKKLKDFWLIIFVILLLTGLSFYWYEYRPSQIKKNCFVSTQENKNEIPKSLSTQQSINFVEYQYDFCLKQNGL